MQSADHDGFDDDEDLRQYVAAFRSVEQPSPAARAATWQAIGDRTSSAVRPWIWIGVAATLAAAVWLVVRIGVVELSLSGAGDVDASRDQAGYLPVSEEEASVVEPAPRPTPRAVEPSVVEAPPAPTPPPVEPVPEVAPTNKRRTEPPRPAPTLADETALFAEIQQALVEKKPSRALEAIARHERLFPRGAFRQERVVAKAQALCAVGRVDAARKVRDGFLARNGSSHLAPRMRAVCPD